jgi:uncharacterized protein (TIGR02611 family)
MHKVGTLVRFIWRSSKRAVVFVIGVVLLAIGLVMFVTPGPGIVLVVLGLAVLATEFAWAEHLLDQAKRQASKAGQASQKIPGVSRAWTWVKGLWPWRREEAAGPRATNASDSAECRSGTNPLPEPERPETRAN